ncbi:TlpA disulfide reductase family protein [Jiulongibacter sediminis]|uniref:TlpA family protein disulfide reductase n=1 Tax=Jiulongibacter sediminis TaxID=1605367 RepID=UPI0026E96C76|nr:TlpA disulfide reductase family protein [Jiulongibacter sediminis]
MKSISKYPFLWFVLLCGTISFCADAQEIKVIRFAELEQLISESKSKVTVVNFWATWCKPCLEEIPSFKTISEKYRLKDVNLLLVSLDFAKDVERVKAFATRKDIGNHVVLLNEPDYNSWIDKIDPKWSGALPATVLLTETGKEFYEKKFEGDELEKRVKTLLNN